MSRREIALSPYVWWAVAAAFAIFAIAVVVCWGVIPPFQGRPRTLVLGIGLAVIAFTVALSPAPKPDSRWTHAVIALAYLGTSAAMFLLAPDGIAALPAAIFVGSLAAIWLEEPREIVAHYIAATVALLAPAAFGVASLTTVVATLTILPPIFVLGFCCLYVLRAVEQQGDRLDALVKRDALTGVGNRRMLDERLDTELARHATTRRPLSVFALDLDGFKAVNDELGHAAGDRLLAFVGQRLTEVAGPRATVARQGGDEFCVVMPQTDAAGARAVGQLLREALAPVVSAGVGHATFPDDGREPRTLLELADARLVAGKERRDDRASDGDCEPLDRDALLAAVHAMAPEPGHGDADDGHEDAAAEPPPTISRAELAENVVIWRITAAMFTFYSLAGAATYLWVPELCGRWFPAVVALSVLASVALAVSRPARANSLASQLVISITYLGPVALVLTCLPGGATGVASSVFIGAIAAVRTPDRRGVIVHTGIAMALSVGVAVSGLTNVGTSLALLIIAIVTMVLAYCCVVVFEAAEAQGRELEHLAVIDPLTGLANRRRLVDTLQEQARRARAGDVPLAVLTLDLNGFKALNDGAGHSAGDELLVDVAEVLRTAVGLPAVIARPGGDEFTIVLPGRDPTEADRIAHAIKAAVARLSRAGHPISTGVGRAVFPADGTTADALLDAADRRLLIDKYGARRTPASA